MLDIYPYLAWFLVQRTHFLALGVIALIGNIMEWSIRFTVNGFGRTGSADVRQWMQVEAPIAFESVAAHVIVLIETCAYLLGYDNAYEPTSAKIVRAESALILKGHSL